jgi:hypothetical protein
MSTDTTSSVVLELSDLRPAGCRMGTTSSDKIGFLGTSPVARQTASSTLVDGTDTTATIITAVNAINTALKHYGLTA